MEPFIQALIVAFREGLEAFLIIAILIKFLDKSDNKKFKRSVWHGTFTGILVSIILGATLIAISSAIGGTDNTAKLWESGASLVAVLLITTFIIWMIKHGRKIKEHVENKAKLNLSKTGIFLLAMVMVLREGAEIAIFSFAGKYPLLPIVAGIALSIIFVLLIFYSIVNIKLSTIFNITLAYLILQAGFLAGYSIHEGLSAAKGLGAIASDNAIFTKAFDLSATPFEHKEGVIGIPLYVSLGWYSRPEWIQFLVQYGLTAALFAYWHFDRKSAGIKGI
ncbi:MAG TPA: FTR1 family protein [Candidatus Nanoarchaeia archaeon]|nr:FTR1 family protein [Candidatus Nanoarchaeia archaeon]